MGAAAARHARPLAFAIASVVSACESDPGSPGDRAPPADAPTQSADSSDRPDVLEGGEPPVDEDCTPRAGSTALCLSFRPEAVAAESEPGLDRRGFFLVQVFETPSPQGGESATAAALYERTFRGGTSDGELSLDELPSPVVRWDDPPPVVYVRALFFDNGAFTSEGGGLNWGTWLGGFDLERGLTNDTALMPVALTGSLTRQDVELVAYRRLSVTVTTSVMPLGDGEGALSIVASRVEGLSPEVPTHGYGIDPCVDVTRGAQRVDAVLVGSGSFFITAYFDDLGIETPGRMPPGILLSIHDFDPATGEAVYDQVTLAEDDYSAEVTLDLGLVTEFEGDPDSIGPNSCADLGFPGSP